MLFTLSFCIYATFNLNTVLWIHFVVFILSVNKVEERRLTSAHRLFPHCGWKSFHASICHRSISHLNATFWLSFELMNNNQAFITASLVVLSCHFPSCNSWDLVSWSVARFCVEESEECPHTWEKIWKKLWRIYLLLYRLNTAPCLTQPYLKLFYFHTNSTKWTVPHNKTLLSLKPLCDYLVTAAARFYYRLYCPFHQFAESQTPPPWPPPPGQRSAGHSAITAAHQTPGLA